MKPFAKLKVSDTPLLVFNHGLGDFINFLPVYHELCLQLGNKVYLGASSKRQFKYIYQDIYETDLEGRLRFDYIYKIMYPDPENTSVPIFLSEEPPKPYICAYYELGMNEFVWKPYELKNDWCNPHSNRIGVHLFGHTGMHKKFCPIDVAEQIWQEIIEAGYKPYECHMSPDFAKEYADYVEADCMQFIAPDCSLRFEKPNLKRMIEEIGKCKFFIGVDSGPIYLATALLGTDCVIGLENQKKHNQFIPKHITTVSVNDYKPGTIYKQLKLKEVWL